MNSHSDTIWHGRRLKGIVFDLDGTLTNSIDVYYDVFSEVAGRLDIHISRQTLFGLLAEGKDPWGEVLPVHTPERAQKIQEYKRLAGPKYAESLKRVHPLPGVPQLLAALHERKFALGLVTDSSEASLEPLRTYSIAHYFSAMITKGNDVPKKPNPKGLLKCLDRMEISRSEAVFVGDSVIDVKAGKEAEL